MTKTQLFAILTAMAATAHNILAYEIHLEPDAAKRRTVTVYRSQGPETAMLYLYAPTPWVIAGSAITAQDDNLWSGFNTTPNNPTHIYRMVNAHSSQQYVSIFGLLTQPGSGPGRNPWFRATVPSVDIDWEKHSGAGHESDEDTWTGVCPVTTNQSLRTKVIVRKLKDDLPLVAPSMTLECWPTDAVRFLKEDGVTALWSGATVSDSDTPLTLYVDPQYTGPFQVTLSGPVDDAFNRPTDYLTGKAVAVDLDVDADNDGAIGDADDPLEEDPGGILATGAVKQVCLKLEPDGLTGKLTLSAVSGGSRIRVWQDAGRGTEVTLPKEWTLAGGGYTFPSTLYVEGVAASASARDVQLRLRYTAADSTTYCDDDIRLTVIKVDLDIDGLSETDEDMVGGLVVRNHDGNNAPRKKITIQKVDPNAWSGNVILTRTAIKAKVFTASSGGSEITFNGTDNKFANSALPKDLYVEGNEQSASMRDIQMKVEAEGFSTCGDPVSFTVLWVDMAVGKHSGTMSSDNAATDSYYSFYTVNPNRLDLGPGEFSDRFGRSTEFRGDVFPMNFVPSEFGMTMNLSRTKDVYSYYSNPSTNGSDVYYHSTGDDTGPTSARDGDPQSGGSAGKIYDFDNPGIPKNQPGDAVGHIRRYRGNFHEYANAIIGGVTTRCSGTMDWYSKQSWQKGTNTWSQINDVANDNANGDGQLTSQTWNMQ